MKSFINRFIFQHLIPLFAAIGVLYLIDSALVGKLHFSAQKTIEITGTANNLRGHHANCELPQSEIELIGSLTNKNKLTLFGSSELQSLPYSAFYFLPDSAGIPVTAFGHAFQQNLSIACQLLAAGENLRNANVCILLSPGWFESEGTNIEAFLEFVRPNFLRRIIHDPNIPEREKDHLAAFVYTHFDEIDNPTPELIYFKQRFLSTKWNNYPKSLTSLVSPVKKVKYNISQNYQFESINKTKNIGYKNIECRIKTNFLNTTQNNSLWVDSTYYSTYLLKEGKYVPGKMEPLSSSNEWNDFELVLSILKRYNCNASFVLQPLNPRHYSGLDNFIPTEKRIETALKKAQFPLLNMFVTSKEEYQEPTLKDIMHPNDLGWMKINAFLIKNYQHVQK